MAPVDIAIFVHEIIILLFQTLVAETLVLAKTHGYVEKIENELEEEIRRDNKAPPKQTVARWRREGEKILRSKYMLLAVVLLCVVDCALVLGELILDLYKVRNTLQSSKNEMEGFISGLHRQYPQDIVDVEVEIRVIFMKILDSKIHWNYYSHNATNLNNDTSEHAGQTSSSRRRRESVSYNNGYDVSTGSGNYSKIQTHNPSVGVKHSAVMGAHKHSVEDDIAHAFHLASITILAILVIETILKTICAGKPFFHRKLEVFDAVIVLISFLVDLVFLNRLPNYEIQDFVFILAFLLPWRVMRVVNSLVVAVKDHEHFRLKLVYSRKKKIQNSLKESEIKLQVFRCQCNALRKLCISEGIDEWKVDQLMRIDEYTVNKSGKCKYKIKIDDTSIMLINDKNDIPRFSPRPSLHNILDVKNRHSLGPCIEEDEPNDLKNHHHKAVMDNNKLSPGRSSTSSFNSK
ncbi:hypothetical protein SNE40_003451 [Patella caerulea]|uniref:Voltage-gated hydrogen channel 1 n=1 Tax=Patella caerulea TaxID=87958 RepID=A0AAN8QF78_PATCE